MTSKNYMRMMKGRDGQLDWTVFGHSHVSYTTRVHENSVCVSRYVCVYVCVPQNVGKCLTSANVLQVSPLEPI